MLGYIPLYCVSVSHKFAPLEIRQIFSVRKINYNDFISCFKAKCCFIKGVVFLSTCNRTEIYFTMNMDETFFFNSKEFTEVELFLASYFNCDIHFLRRYTKTYFSDKAINHLFTVYCGLESVFIGENEIIGQIRHAYLTALELKVTDNLLNLIFQKGLYCAKTSRNYGQLEGNSTSMASLVAKELGKAIANNKGKNGYNQQTANDLTKDYDGVVMLVGASGQMGQVIVNHITDRLNIKLLLTEHRHKLSIVDKKVQIIPYADRYQYLSECDVVISVTSCPYYTFTYQECKEALDKRRNDFITTFYDLCVPFNIDVDVGKCPNTELKNLEYFNKIQELHGQNRDEWYISVQDLVQDSVNTTVNECYLSIFMEAYSSKNISWELPFTLKKTLPSNAFYSFLSKYVDTIF